VKGTISSQIVNVNLLQNNYDLAQIKSIKSIHTGQVFFVLEYSPLYIVNMKWSPITSVEVEML